MSSKDILYVYLKRNLSLQTLLATYGDCVWTESLATRAQLLVFFGVFRWTHLTAGPPCFANGAAAGGACHRVSKRNTADAVLFSYTEDVQETFSFTAVC